MTTPNNLVEHRAPEHRALTTLTDDELQERYWEHLDDEYTDLFVEAAGLESSSPDFDCVDTSNTALHTDPEIHSTIMLRCMDELIRKEYN